MIRRLALLLGLAAGLPPQTGAVLVQPEPIPGSWERPRPRPRRRSAARVKLPPPPPPRRERGPVIKASRNAAAARTYSPTPCGRLRVRALLK